MNYLQIAQVIYGIDGDEIRGALAAGDGYDFIDASEEAKTGALRTAIEGGWCPEGALPVKIDGWEQEALQEILDTPALEDLAQTLYLALERILRDELSTYMEEHCTDMCAEVIADSDYRFLQEAS